MMVSYFIALGWLPQRLRQQRRKRHVYWVPARPHLPINRKVPVPATLFRNLADASRKASRNLAQQELRTPLSTRYF